MKLACVFVAIAAAASAQEFVHGDECLFCHRNNIGPLWQKNSHGVAMRQVEDAPELIALLKNEASLQQFAAEATHTLGSRNHIRFLKQSGYGKQDILSARADLDKDRKIASWNGSSNASWQAGKFGAQCAGCHATAVDSKTRAYSEIGIDCYACHGLVDLQHTTDTSKIFLSKKRRNDPLAITNACAQCHLRGAKARSTGLPYPNGFSAGGDLLKDYEADFAKADDASLNPGDRHVWASVRDVVKNGSDTTCISCHRVHANSSERHRRVLTSALCQQCHNAEGPKKAVKQYAVHSALCEY